MPRYDLSHTEKLDPVSVEAIVSAIAPFGAEDAMRAAFARYPGPSDATDHIAPNLPPAKNLRNCIIEVNKEVMLRPFLSRLIEDQWGNASFKDALLRKMPDLVLAPLGLQTALQGVRTGVRRLLELIADEPKCGAVGKQAGDDKAFAIVCRNRKVFVELRESLGHLQALKELHDALHILAIAGADWLDQTLDDDDDPNPIILPVAALAVRVAEAKASVDAKSPALKDEHVVLGRKAVDALSTALSELTSADAAAHAAGVERLRQALMILPKEIDAAMFCLSRDLPVRALSRAFANLNHPEEPNYAGFDGAQLAVAQLGEALRGRVLEHAMWQATDVSIHVLENILSERDPSFLKPFVERWQEVRRFIRYLSDVSFGSNPPDLLVGMALDAYDRALRSPAGGPAALSLNDAFSEIVKTFSAFKAFPRERFLAVDKSLKDELALISALKADLDELLDKRVFENCGLLVSPLIGDVDVA